MMKTFKSYRILPILMIIAALAWPSAAFAQDAEAADKAWRAGFKAFQEGNPRQCIVQMRAALKAAGEVYERWGWLRKTLGICLAQRRQHDDAISELQAAKELVSEDADRFEVNHGLAQVYVARGNAGDYDRAIASENEAAKYASGSRRKALVDKTIGQSYYFKEDWRNAIKHLEKSAASRTTDADLAQKLGRAYLEAGNTTKAMVWFQKTLALDRDNTAAVTNMGRLYLNEGNWSEAVRYLQLAVRADPQNMQVRNLLGRAYLGEKRYNDAISQLVQVVQSRSSDGGAHYNLGQAYQASGKDAQAIESYTAALAYLSAGSTTRADCLYDIGFVYEKVGNYEDALQALEASAAIDASTKTTEAIARVKVRISRQQSGS